MGTVKVGIIGCGVISDEYIKGCRAFENLEVVACADIDTSRAEARAGEHGLRALAVNDLLADSAIDIVVNLTIPDAHATVSLAVIEAGKHVYSEKPLAVTREDGRRILEAAEAKGARVGCGPDTFLGGGLQTCIKLVREGAIGEPVAAGAFFTSHGPESWHPDPAFFYQVGAGPLFDMGPYYLTALINLLGPVRGVTGMTRASFPERLISSKPLFGQKISVKTPTHISGVLDFEQGAVATLMMSFDVWATHLPYIEIYGSEGSLSVPDPNTFGGPVRLRLAGEKEWREAPLSHRSDMKRGMGVADMALALMGGRPHRASGELAYHVLDTMHAIEDASRSSRHAVLETSCRQPELLPPGLLAEQIG